MPQRYKLRLGDGTVLSVDSNGLRSWAADARATVQAVGSWRWQPLQDVLAEEEAAARLLQALVPPKPRQPDTPAPPAPAPPPPPPPPPLELPEFDLGAPPVESLPPPRPSLQALADDPMSVPEPAAVGAPDDLPVIPMKPLDDEPEFRSAFSERPDEEEVEEVEDEPRRDRLDGPLLTVLETGGGFLSRVLNRLTPLATRLTTRRAEDPDVRRVAAANAPRPSAVPAAAAPTLLTLAEDPAASRDFVADAEDAAEDDRPSFLARASGFWRDLGARLRRPAKDEDQTEEGEPPAPLRQPAAWTPPAPAARQPAAAPTPLSELPALRFVESREPRVREDVYAGDEPSRSWNLQPLWSWTKRLVTAGALVAALVYAVRERDTWLPRTAEVGQTVFTQIDRQVLSRERREQRERALADASARLPELAPETIALVFERSPTGIVDPAEVFQIAREAADRGLGALTEAEAQELRALARELLAALSRTEAERVREYDRTRARRVIFPFENPHVMELVARGARALPAERLAQLQALSHKAVAAGLDRPEPTAEPVAGR